MGIPTPAIDMRWRVIAVVVLASVAGYRLLTEWDIPDRVAFDTDAFEYQTMAVNFSRGFGLTAGPALPFELYRFDRTDNQARDLHRSWNGGSARFEFYRVLGYPLFLGALYSVAGIRPDIAVVVQLLFFALVLAQLPLMGEQLFGPWGFFAGLLAPFRLLESDIEHLACIASEALIVVMATGLVWAWIVWSRRPGSAARGALFGLTLALATLCKGVFLFFVPLFVLYVLRSRLFRNATPGLARAAAMLLFVLPLVSYSAFASVESGSFVLLSTQGDDLLLDGNNEVSLRTGGWQPEWRADPEAFYSTAFHESPGASTVGLVLRFYAHHAVSVPRMLARKLNAAFGHPFKGWMAVVLFTTAAWLVLAVGGDQRALVLMVILLSVALVAGWSRPTFFRHVVAWLALVAVGGVHRGIRERLRDWLESPTNALITSFICGLVVLSVVAFGDPRFVFPFLFLFELCRAFMFIWMLRLFLDALPHATTS